MTLGLSSVLPLQAACNLRDLGGYECADGRHLKSGVLYRSGVMAYFTDADRRYIGALNIHTVCDLRRSDEQAKEPSCWPQGSTTQFVTWPDEPDLEGQGHLAWGQADDPEQIRHAMITFYRAMPTWLGSRLRGVFQHLCQADLPLLFHCSAGKDRTGMTAALILYMLGASEAQILADYEQTNTAVNLEAFALAHHNAGMGLADEQHPLLSLREDIRRTILRADGDYMRAAFTSITQQFGGIDNYLSDYLGVTEAAQISLRQRLLEA